MITVFNRKELLMSYDLRQVNDLRELLRANRIDYYVKAVSSRTPFAMSEARARTASFGPARNLERYTVYVRKTDYDRVLYLLRKL